MNRIRCRWRAFLVSSAFLLLSTYMVIVSELSRATDDNPYILQGSYVQDGEILNEPEGSCRHRLPQILIIGVAKSGTKALINFLDFHPDIVERNGEVNYFNWHYFKGPEWYRNEMPCTLENEVNVEKSPMYFWDDKVPGRVKTMNSSMKLILIVRDPISRALSHYLMINRMYRNDTGKYVLHLRDGYISESIEENWNYMKASSFEEFVVKKDGSVHEDCPFLQHSIYSHYLETWLAYFPRNQLHIVNGEEFITDPLTELVKIEQFLGVRPFFKPSHIVYNPQKGFYCLNFQGDIQRCVNGEKGHQHPIVDPRTAQTLKGFFKPYNDAFYRLAGQSFHWDT